MATYEIYKKDGTPVRVQGPPNLSFKEVLSIYESGGKSAPSQPSVFQPRIKAREPDVLDRLGEVPKSVGRGVLTFLEDGIKGWTIPAEEGVESYLRDKITGGIGALRQYTKPDLYFQQAQMDPNASWTDVVPNKFGEALGSFVGIGGTALIPYAGVPLATALVVGGGMEEQKQRAIAAGKLDQLSAREVGGGALVGVTELLPIRLLRDGSKASLTVLNRLKRAFITGGVEGLQEASAQYAQNWIEQTGYNPQVELKEGTGEAFAYGDAVGALVQGVMDIIAPRRGVRATTVAQELEDIGVTPKDDDPSTKAPGAPPSTALVPEGGQFELFPGANLGTKPKEKVTQKEDVTKTTPKEKQLETFLPGTDLGTKPKISDKEKYESIMKGVSKDKESVKDKKPAETTQKQLLLPPPKNTKEAVEKIIKERIQDKENVASNINKRADGVSTKDSGQDAVSEGDIGIDSEGAKALTGDGLGNIGRDTRPDNVAEKQGDGTLTSLQRSILDTYRKTGVVPPFQDRSAKIFKRMGYDVKNQEDIANALKDLEAKDTTDTTDTTQVEPPVAAQPKKGQMELFPGANLGTTTRPEEVVEDQPDTSVTDPNQLEMDLKPPANNEIDFNKKETQDLLSLVVDDTLPGFDEKNQKAIDYENETFDGDRARGEALAEAFKKIEKELMDKGILEGSAIRRAIEKTGPKIKVTSDQAKEIIKKYKATQKQIAKEKNEENNQTAEERKKAAKKRAYKKDEPKRLEAKKIINDIYEGNAKKPQTGTQKGALIKEFHDRQELSKDTVDYKIMSSDLASIGILMNTSDYKLKKEFPPKKGKASVGVSAKRYFTKSSNPNVVISMIIEDSLGDINYRADPEVSAAENAFYEFTGPEGAKNALLWIKENLSADLNNTIEEKIKDSTTEIASEEFGNVILTSKTNAQVNATVAKNEKQQDFNDALDKQGLLRGGLDPFKVDSDMRNFSLDNYGRGRSNVSLAAMKPTLNKMGEKGLDQSSTLLLSMPMYSMAQKALRNGQLKTALNIIAGKSYGKRNRELAKGFSKYIGSTKVEVVDNLRLKETGNKVSGLFDPQTNTIKLDSKTGLNNHTLFHELTHATTSATLANPSHPLSKQVTMLYNAVKDRLGTVYGSRNTEEFLAEAISNSEFRKDLATIYVKKEPYSSLDKFLHALNNFVRKYILGKETITLPDFKGYTQFRSPLGMFDITNVEEEVTRLVNEINAPSPKNRDAFELGLEDANAIITDLQNISEKQKGKYNPKKFAKEVTALATGTAGGLGAKARQLLLQLLPMQATGDLLNYQDRDGSKNFDGLVMQKVLFDQEAGVVKLSERIEGSIENIKRNIPRGKLDNFNKVVSLSSRFQVDPSKGRKAYEKDPEKVEVWQTMQPMWNELGDKGKEAYQDLRNVYVTLFNKLKDVIYGRIDGLDLNKGAKKH